MSGLLFYAELFSKWISGLSLVWNFLNKNIIKIINDIVYQPGGILGDGVWQFINLLLRLFGFENYTLLEFVLSMCGVGFGFYFVFSLFKWFIDLLP